MILKLHELKKYGFKTWTLCLAWPYRSFFYKTNLIAADEDGGVLYWNLPWKKRWSTGKL